jgi:hypothetical protein
LRWRTFVLSCRTYNLDTPDAEVLVVECKVMPEDQGHAPVELGLGPDLTG